MRELRTDLYQRCQHLLAKCDQFESNESVKSVFSGTEIAEYADHVQDKNKRDDRIKEVIRVLANRGHQHRSVLALFLQRLGQLQPDGDDTGAALIHLAQDVFDNFRSGDTSLHPTLVTLNFDNTGHSTEEEKARRVLVIRSRNEAARIEMSNFLKGANLVPVEWNQIEANVQKIEPSVEDILQAAFNYAQAVIVIFNGDEMAKLRNDLAERTDVEGETKFDHQPEPDILFKAGVAFSREPTRTILIALGKVRLFHVSLERHVVRLTNDDEDRKKLIAKLKQAHCIVTGHEWSIRGNFNNPAFY